MNWFLALLIVVLCVGILLCLARLFSSTTLAERTVAVDGIVFQLMGILILVSVLRQTDLYLDAVLIIALLGFISTLTVARYLEFSDDVD